MAAQDPQGRHRDRDRRQGPRQDRQASCASTRKKQQRLRRGPEHRQAPPRPQQVRDAQRAEQVGGVIEKEGPIHVSNVMLVDPKDEQAHARRHRARRGRHAPPRRPPLRNEDRLDMPCPHDSRSATSRRSARADQAVQLHDPDAGAEDHEDHAEHGRRRRQAGLEHARGRHRAARDDRRPEARTSAARGSRSRPSSCARACPSACP